MVDCPFKMAGRLCGMMGSIIVWWLGGFGPILDAEYGCCKQISAVYGFCVAKRLRKIGI